VPLWLFRIFLNVPSGFIGLKFVKIVVELFTVYNSILEYYLEFYKLLIYTFV